MYLTEKVISNKIQEALNTISNTLYDSEVIDTKVVFKITPNVADYDTMVDMEYVVGDSINYTPVLLKSVASSMQDDFISGTYTEGYICEILAFDKDKDSIEKIFNQYAYDESLNDSFTIDDWTILKANTSRIRFNQTYSATDGSNEDRISYSFDFTWQFVLGGIMDGASSFKINTKAIDVIGVSFVSDKLSIANVAFGDNVTPIGATGFTLSLTIPAQNLTDNKALYSDLLSKQYNKQYTIEWVISNFHTQSYDMLLRSGTVNYQRDQLISYTLTFEEALPRTSITVDSINLPILDFNYSRSNEIISNALPVEIKSAGTQSFYEMDIKFGYLPTIAKSQDLLKAILNCDYMQTTYEIILTLAGGVSKTYNVMLKSGSYTFQQTAELIYDCKFVEVDTNGV